MDEVPDWVWKSGIACRTPVGVARSHAAICRPEQLTHYVCENSDHSTDHSRTWRLK